MKSQQSKGFEPIDLFRYIQVWKHKFYSVSAYKTVGLPLLPIEYL